MTTKEGREIRMRVRFRMVSRQPRLRTAHAMARQLQADGVDSGLFLHAPGFYPMPRRGSTTALALGKLVRWEGLQFQADRPALHRPYGRMPLVPVRPGPALDQLLNADHPDRDKRRAKFRLKVR